MGKEEKEAEEKAAKAVELETNRKELLSKKEAAEAAMKNAKQ